MNIDITDFSYLIPQLVFFLTVVGLNTLTSVMVALYTSAFDWKKLGAFAKEKGGVLVFWLVIQTAGVFANVVPENVGGGIISIMGYGSYATIMASEIANFLKNIVEFGTVLGIATPKGGSNHVAALRQS